MSTINLTSTRRNQMMNDPKFIRDIQDQMEILEIQMDTMVIHTTGDASNYFNIVKEHSDLEDVLTSLLDDDGHDLP